ncbi:MAG: VOC family protein [Chloroflexi bacterium]|nr:VOC family protein [Chloroflexota bacterium]
MTQDSSDRIPPWANIYQIGVVVRDIERAKSFYEALGIGPFEEGPSAHVLDRRIHGQASPSTIVRGATTQLGPIELELLEPVAGPSVQREFLDRNGEGAIHICAITDDLAADIKWMESRGFAVTSYGRMEDGTEFAYFDTAGTGGLVLELGQYGPKAPTPE